jgi:hypothetical protein
VLFGLQINWVGSSTQFIKITCVSLDVRKNYFFFFFFNYKDNFRRNFIKKKYVRNTFYLKNMYFLNANEHTYHFYRLN